MTTLVTVELVHMECGKCGAVFGVSRKKYDRCRDHGEGWWCPNGHSRMFTENEVARLKSRLKWAEKQRDNERHEHQYTKDRLRTTKAAHTKTKKRIHNGVCPHCNRHFVNVERHMKSQHRGIE